MSAPMAAGTFVEQTRFLSQKMDAGTYRDGFSDDLDTTYSLIPIVYFVNLAVRMLLTFGILHNDVALVTASGTIRYPIPSGVGKVVEVTWTSSGATGPYRKPLRNITLRELESREREYRTVFGEPNLYLTLGSEIQFFPNPHLTGPAYIRAFGLANALVRRNDFLTTEFPIWYMDAIPIVSALLLCASDMDNESSASRIPFLTMLSDMLYPELSELSGARSIIVLRARRESGITGRRAEAEDPGG